MHKNRFSKLLKHLLEVAEMKNSVLAQDLQYDVSYISKWLNGRTMPTKKTILTAISKCVVNTSSENGIKELQAEYSVDTVEELQQAINDHLEVEYNYVKNTPKDEASHTNDKTEFIPQMPLTEYIQKLQHPALRQVRSVNVVSMLDMMNWDNESRLQFCGFENGRLNTERYYNGVHFSLIMNIDHMEWNYIYDIQFLICMLVNFLQIDFSLYSDPHAYGKAVFTIQDSYLVSGMQMDRQQCTSVVVSENPAHVQPVNEQLKSLCKQENIMFNRVTADELLESGQYLNVLMSQNPRWILGNLADLFLPEALFRELVESLATPGLEEEIQKYVRAYNLCMQIRSHTDVQVILYESALSNFVLNGELVFFHYKVKLTTEQKISYLESLISMLQTLPNLNLKLVNGRLVPDFQDVSHQNVCLSDRATYLTLDNGRGKSEIYMVNNQIVKNAFDEHFKQIWESDSEVIVSDVQTIIEYLRHNINSIQLLSNIEE